MPHLSGKTNYKSSPGHPKPSGFVGNKIKKILKEGVRRNTKKPVSSSNPRRKVPQKQAVAIALSIARKKGLAVGQPKNPNLKKALNNLK